MAACTVDALLFDLGRVVIDVDFDLAIARWAKHASCDEARLRERFAHDAAFKRHETGTLSDQAYFSSLRTSLDITITDAELLDGWNAIFVGEMQGISDLLARVTRQVPAYAFSNSNPAHEVYWSRRFAGVLGYFHAVYVSSTIGLRKPDAKAYAYVIGAMGVAPDRIAFFDDNPENVEAAQRCGLRAFHVASSSDIDVELTRLGL